VGCGLTTHAHGPYRIAGDRDLLDMDVVHDALSVSSYWARGRTRETLHVAFANSRVAVALDADGATVGFARAVTDGATHAWLADVWVVPAHRGHGLGAALTRFLVEAPDLRDVRRWCLVTSNAQGLYERLGFEEVDPATGPTWMQRLGPTI
jgi:ribosomal protein S18 acetylase RimI-like enzyme